MMQMHSAGENSASEFEAKQWKKKYLDLLEVSKKMQKNFFKELSVYRQVNTLNKKSSENNTV